MATNPLIYPIQTSFAGGEVSPDIYGRPDLAKYANSAKTMLNFFPHPYGGASNRSGTECIAEVKTSSRKTRLVRFEFSVIQAYILEFGHLYIRVYKDGGQVLNGSAPVEITTTYTEAELPDLKFAQSADILYICHPAHKPAQLTRYSHTSWTLTDFGYYDGPFRTANTDKSLTITPSSNDGNITLTASKSLFTSAHVGSLWQINHDVYGQSTNMDFSGNGISATILCKGPWKVVTHGTWNGIVSIKRSEDSNVTWKEIRCYSSRGDNNVADSGDETEKMVRMRAEMTDFNGSTHCYCDLSAYSFTQYGIVLITSVVSGTVAYATVMQELGSTAATSDWAEGAWNSVNGFPRCSKFYQNRLGFAGSNNDPLTLWLSKTGDYLNFGRDPDNVKDNDAITAPLVSQGVNTIRSLVSLSDMLAFTAAGEWVIGTGGQASALTSKTIQATQQEYCGAAALEPLIVGNRVLFVQQMGSIVRDFGYSLQDYSYTGNDLTILARHLFRNHTIVDWAYQQEPDSIVWAVRDDGVLLAFTYLKSQDVWAWSRHTTQGFVESVATIPGTDRDELWLVVRRTIGGETKRFVERLAARMASTAPADQFFVDCGITYSGTATTTISGLAHLNGMTVKVLADGEVQNGKTVSGGSITLDKAASKVHVGLGYVCDLETLDIDFTAKDGTVQGRKKRVPAVTVRLENSRGGYIGPSADKLTKFNPSSSTYWGVSADLYTGDIRTEVKNETQTKAHVFIRQTDPLPITVLAIMAEIEFNG